MRDLTAFYYPLFSHVVHGLGLVQLLDLADHDGFRSAAGEHLSADRHFLAGVGNELVVLAA